MQYNAKVFGYDPFAPGRFSAEQWIGTMRISLCVENGLICVMIITPGH
jgi:hypothetical protein